MNRLEKLIAFYNNKYQFDISKGSINEQKEYNLAVKMWDAFKVKRDQLKAQTI